MDVNNCKKTKVNKKLIVRFDHISFIHIYLKKCTSARKGWIIRPFMIVLSYFMVKIARFFHGLMNVKIQNTSDQNNGFHPHQYHSLPTW